MQRPFLRLYPRTIATDIALHALTCWVYAGLCALVAVDAFAPTAMPLQNRARLATSSSRPAAAVSLRMNAGAQVDFHKIDCYTSRAFPSPLFS